MRVRVSVRMCLVLAVFLKMCEITALELERRGCGRARGRKFWSYYYDVYTHTHLIVFICDIKSEYIYPLANTNVWLCLVAYLCHSDYRDAVHVDAKVLFTYLHGARFATKSMRQNETAAIKAVISRDYAAASIQLTSQ